MPVDTPDFDLELDGYAAIVFEEGNRKVCHALTSSYTDGNTGQIDMTYCGIELSDDHRIGEPGSTRGELMNRDDVRGCPECWPDSILE